jgi:hypothetical protein
LIAPLERELGVPDVQAIAARIWEIQKRLHVHEAINGYGRLLETLPEQDTRAGSSDRAAKLFTLWRQV